MILETLEFRQFRCFQHLKLHFHPRCNVFVGGNGQGKTSILEGIYVLSRGQSFRTHLNSPLIQFDTPEFALQAETFSADTIFVHKTLKTWRKIELNHKPCQRWSELSKLFPCLVFHQDLFQIIDANAEIRRRLLDWGVFYHYPAYVELWRDFKRVLLQRNTVLKQGGRAKILTPWNQSFVSLAEKIDHCRREYFAKMSALFYEFLAEFSNLNCQLLYFNGWQKQDVDAALLDILVAQEAWDSQQMYTHSGPQRADLLFLTVHGQGKLEWSRGQQKIILILLKLAQAQLLGQPALFLMDDLGAELSEANLEKVYQQIAKLPNQLFLTALDDTAKDLSFFQDSRWFYLNQGRIENIIDL